MFMCSIAPRLHIRSSAYLNRRSVCQEAYHFYYHCFVGFEKSETTQWSPIARQRSNLSHNSCVTVHLIFQNATAFP